MTGAPASGSAVRGTTAVTVVPPARDASSTVTVPPTASSRSRMLARPDAGPRCRRRAVVEAGAVVGDGEPPSARVLGEPHRHAAGAGVLGGVLHRLHAAEVQGGLDRCSAAVPSPSASTVTGIALVADRGPQGRHQALVGQQPRVDPAGQRGQRLDRHPRRVGLLGEHARRRAPVSGRRSSARAAG